MSSTASQCPTCGAAVSAGQLQRFGGACSRCVLLFLAEDAPPQFPNLQLQEVLGRGGMGVVYRAVQPHLNRTVALKVLSPKLTDEPGALERFTREAAAMAKLQHPHIVTLYDFGVHGGVPFLVMEYVEGTSLRRQLKQGPLPPDRALEVALTLCSTLEYAHRRGVVHRDLKPENVLIDAEGRVKLADFGLARLSDSETTRLTGPQGALGTPGYMAPEQIERPQEVDLRADLYSLGILLYEMLTGTLPVGRFAPPSVQSGVDRRVDPMIDKLLERDPARRFESAGTLKQALLRVRTPGLIRGWRRAAAAGAALLTLVLIALLLRRPTEVPPSPPPPAPAWTDLGGSGTGDGLSTGPQPAWYPALVMDRSGHPVAAWQDGPAHRSTIRVSRWTGSAWLEPGSSRDGLGVSLDLADAGHPTLALDSQDRPWVAWHDNRSGNYEIYLRRWDGSSWSELAGSGSGGGVSRSPAPSTRPCLALDRQDRPIVAWCDRLTRTAFEMQVCRWDGTAWTPLAAASAFATRQLPSPILAVDPSDRPLIAWRSAQEKSTVYRVHRLEAGAWRELEGLCPEADAAGEAWEQTHAAMALDRAGHPVVAYGFQFAPAPLVRVRRWNGREWQNIGEAVDGGVRDAVSPALPAVGLDPEGQPVVAWTYGLPERRILHVRRWKEVRWVDLGRFDLQGAVPSLGWTTPVGQSLALDARGTPHLAFVDQSNGLWKIFLRRFDR